MFDSMISKIIKPNSVDWSNTKYIKLSTDKETEDKDNIYLITKGAENALHKYIDLKPGTSKEVFKKSEDIWKQLCSLLLSKANDLTGAEHFNLTDDYVVYLTSNQQLIDVVDLKTEQGYNDFKDKLDKFILDITTMDKTRKFYTECKGGLVKLIAYNKDKDITKELYTPCVFIEYNTTKSSYNVNTGIIIYNTENEFSSMRLIPSTMSLYECNQLNDFIARFNMDESIKQAEDEGESLYNQYKTIIENPIEMSAREVVSLMKKLGYKLSIKPDENLATIDNITDEYSNELIQNFFNTFISTTGETALDILRLSEVKKVFRYNTLTTVDILDILCKEYLSYYGSKVTCDLLGDLLYTISTKHVDKNQTDSIKQEINND